MSEFHRPDVEEFRLGARREFSYLLNEYGFVERKAPLSYENPYSIFFRAARRFVHIEGLSCGIALGVSIGRLGALRNIQHRVSLFTLISLRAPQLLEPRFGDKRGQLEDMKFSAAALRQCASDFLSGDFSALPEALQFQAGLEDAAREAREEAEAAQAFIRASDAFHRGQFELAVCLLEPYYQRFGKAQQAMPTLARKRLAARQ